MNARRTMVAGAMGLALCLGGGLAAAPAYAGSADIVRSGSCTGATDYKLKVGPRDGMLRVEFEVDSNIVGQVWSVSIRDNGVLRMSGTRTTLAPSGSFTVIRRIPDMVGSDLIRARAANAVTGEVCSASLTFG